jgi:acetyl-CoA C-acetyltransferase
LCSSPHHLFKNGQSPHIPPARISVHLRDLQSSTEVVIVAASRTPVGSLNGALKTLTAPELGTIALKHALDVSKVSPELIEEIYFGNVVQAGVGQSPLVRLRWPLESHRHPMPRR